MQLDCITIVDALSSKDVHSMVVALVLEECHNLLSGLGKIILEQCNRESNAIVHELAKLG